VTRSWAWAWANSSATGPMRGPCAAILDALQAVGIGDPKIAACYTLLERIVSMLTKMMRSPTPSPTTKR
jgi:hypothetical protein